MTEHLHRHPFHRHESTSRDDWPNPNNERDEWEERPQEVAFWAIPLLVTMLAMAAVIIYFSMTS